MKKVLLVLVLLAIGFNSVFAQNDAQAHFNRGVTHFENGQYDQAIAAFTEVIRLAPNNVNGYYNRGIVYGEKGDYDRAIADYTQDTQVYQLSNLPSVVIRHGIQDIVVV